MAAKSHEQTGATAAKRAANQPVAAFVRTQLTKWGVSVASAAMFLRASASFLDHGTKQARTWALTFAKT